MAVRWFRISFARNAFLRFLDAHQLDLASVSLMHGIRAMVEFSRDHKPQHAELDELTCSWGPAESGYEFAIVRRMRRHDQPEATLSLVYGYTQTAERTETGSHTISRWQDASETAGYRAVVKSKPRYRRLD